VWTKSRNNITDHGLIDSVRGVSTLLSSNTTGAESSAANNYVTAFNSNGFGVNQGSVSGYSGYTYVGWQWQAGQGTTSSNTNGSITSTVSVNATAGFSIVTYTGTGATGNQTVGHGLGVTPSMVIWKSRSTVVDWNVNHIGIPSQGLVLDNTSAATSGSGWTGGGGALGYQSNSTSTTFSLLAGSVSNNNMNTNGATYVAYCWAPVAGFSQFGSYTGNGSTDGPFVYCGFRPRYVMVKRTDSTGNWIILDTARSPYNYLTNDLLANTSDAEYASSGNWGWDFLSNGFKLRDNGTQDNSNGGTYVYAAFAENPFKYANAR
jgi:hypothetical protein